MKRTYPASRADKARHVLYWASVVVIFIPTVTLYGVAALAERVEGWVSKWRRWCYRERYAAPWDRRKA